MIDAEYIALGDFICINVDPTVGNVAGFEDFSAALSISTPGSTIYGDEFCAVRGGMRGYFFL